MKYIDINTLTKEMINELIDKEERFCVITRKNKSTILPSHLLSPDADAFWGNRDRLSRTIQDTATGKGNSGD